MNSNRSNDYLQSRLKLMVCPLSSYILIHSCDHLIYSISGMPQFCEGCGYRQVAKRTEAKGRYLAFI